VILPLAAAFLVLLFWDVQFQFHTLEDLWHFLKTLSFLSNFHSGEEKNITKIS
jgi:hypothetical protein